MVGWMVDLFVEIAILPDKLQHNDALDRHAENTGDDPETDRESTRRENSVGPSSMLSLTAAFACGLLSNLRSEPIQFHVNTPITAGVCGRLMYTSLLPWRGTVVTSLIVLSVTIFAAVATLFGAGDGVIDILALPINLYINAGISTLGHNFLCLRAYWSPPPGPPSAA